MSVATQRPDEEEIADELSEKPREILLQFAGSEDGLTTHTITTATGYSNAVVGNHIKGKLTEHDLVEKTAEDADKYGSNEYALTPRGEGVLNVYRQRQAETEADISRVDELEDTVERLEKENGNLRKRCSTLEGRFEDLKKYVERVERKAEDT